MIKDRRIWFPDETCHPFLLETVHSGTDVRIIGFRTPDNHYGVISEFDFHGDTSFLTKTQSRIYISEGNKPVSGAGSYPEGMKTTGSLMNVFENSSGVNTDGIAIAILGASRRNCRILLRPGQEYSVFVIGLIAQTLFASISGWTFTPYE